MGETLTKLDIDDIAQAVWEYSNRELTAGTKDSEIDKILALSYSNYKFINPVYDTNDRMTGAIVKGYANTTDLENDENEIVEFELTLAYDAEGKLTSYQAKEV
jgi:hypothetical protein